MKDYQANVLLIYDQQAPCYLLMIFYDNDRLVIARKVGIATRVFPAGQ
jgi:hypothetical protein